eukprot:1871688-Rhodomonas_salina.1
MQLGATAPSIWGTVREPSPGTDWGPRTSERNAWKALSQKRVGIAQGSSTGAGRTDKTTETHTERGRSQPRLRLVWNGQKHSSEQGGRVEYGGMGAGNMIVGYVRIEVDFDSARHQS